MEEEHGGEEGILEGLKNGKGKITKNVAQDRAVELKTEILESSETSFEQKRLAKAIKKDFAKIVWEKGMKDEAELYGSICSAKTSMSWLSTSAYVFDKRESVRCVSGHKHRPVRQRRYASHVALRVRHAQATSGAVCSFFYT
ncbi:MAG: hypothetical protein ABR577_13660 [Pyrinomonadaceae bacterium]